MALHILFESALGYSLFESKEYDEIGSEECTMTEAISDMERFSKIVTLLSFQPFKFAEKALENMTAIADGKITEELKGFLESNSISKKIKLGVEESKLSIELKAELGINAVCNEKVLEVIRGIRMHFVKYIKKLSTTDFHKAQLGMGHSYSRSRIQYDINRQDKSITQSIAVIDQLDKDINTFCMRLKEWFLWHFPELNKIVSDNAIYVKIVNLIESRESVTEELKDKLTEVTLSEEVSQAIIDAAKNSMGQEIMQLDKDIIKSLSKRTGEMIAFRDEIQAYLKERMSNVCPNMAALAGENVGARLIAHAGSLINLAKLPASTIQILGAEKALFRALKEKGNTPKYGLIYHSTYIGRAGAKNKGKISRALANKLALSSRIDAFSKHNTEKFGVEHKKQLEERLVYFVDGKRPRTNAEAMESVLAELKEDGLFFNTAEQVPKETAQPTTEVAMETKEVEQENKQKKKAPKKPVEELEEEVAEEKPKKAKKAKKVEEVEVEDEVEKPKKAKKAKKVEEEQVEEEEKPKKSKKAKKVEEEVVEEEKPKKAKKEKKEEIAEEEEPKKAKKGKKKVSESE